MPRETVYDEIEIEDFTWDPRANVFHYPCPCGDRFEISKSQLRDGEDIATCPSCSLIVRVIYEWVSVSAPGMTNARAHEFRRRITRITTLLRKMVKERLLKRTTRMLSTRTTTSRRPPTSPMSPLHLRELRRLTQIPPLHQRPNPHRLWLQIRTTDLRSLRS